MRVPYLVGEHIMAYLKGLVFLVMLSDLKIRLQEDLLPHSVFGWAISFTVCCL